MKQTPLFYTSYLANNTFKPYNLFESRLSSAFDKDLTDKRYYLEFMDYCKKKFETDLAVVKVEMATDRLIIIETTLQVSFFEKLGMVGKYK